MNHKRVYRLYREEGLALKARRPKRRRSAAARVQPTPPQEANERWAMDFIHDTLESGRSVRILSVIDVHTRECLALVPRPSFRGVDVADVVSELGGARKLPEWINVDNGTEFTSKTLDHWAYWNGVELAFSRPGKPTDNAHVEAFHGTLRRKCLSQHWFWILRTRTERSRRGGWTTTTTGPTVRWGSCRRLTSGAVATSHRAGSGP